MRRTQSSHRSSDSDDESRHYDREGGSKRPTKSSREPNNREQAMQLAMKLLANRSHSQKELERKLQNAGFTDECAMETIDTCLNRKWLNDAEFARHNAAALLRDRGHGPLFIVHKLIEHGVHRPTAEKVLAEVLAEEGNSVNWDERARALLERRLAPPFTRKDLAREQRFLMGRGFPLETIRRVLPWEDAE